MAMMNYQKSLTIYWTLKPKSKSDNDFVTIFDNDFVTIFDDHDCPIIDDQKSAHQLPLMFPSMHPPHLPDKR